MTEAQPTETTDAEQQSEQAEAKEAAEQAPNEAAEQAPKEEAKAAEPEAAQETMSMESLMASHDAYEESFRELKRGESFKSMTREPWWTSATKPKASSR